MGNSSSGQQQVTLVDGPGPPHSWAHSFPRTSSFKVLPERIPGQRLRHTNNGAILQNGGTISGRKPYGCEPKLQRHRSGGVLQERGGVGGDYNRRAMYGSEPDLRYSSDSRRHHYAISPHPLPNGQCYYNSSNDSSAKSRIGRSRKKYKAPPAPSINNQGSSSPDSYHQWETSGDSSEVTAPMRRSRLFKTRAETKRTSVENGTIPTLIQQQNRPLGLLPPPRHKPMGIPGQLQRSLSSPQFQDELTAKLRQRAVREPPVGKAADSPRSSPVLKAKENLQYLRRNISKSNQEIAPIRQTKTLPNGKPPHKINGTVISENATTINGYRNSANKDILIRPRMTRTEKLRLERRNNINGKLINNSVKTKEQEIDKKQSDKPPVPVKKFYFGMEMEENISPKLTSGESEVVEKFAAGFRKSAPTLSSTSPSDSYSSGPTTTDEANAGISLKLRPTLPRKQLDIPRFSPTAAWRLLSALESPVHSEEDDLVMIEEQIPHPHLGHISNDKSGDSGISGDTSPQHQDSAHNSQVTWTPQQDLEETSSDGGLESAPVSPESIGTAKFSPRFSLSLPRDERAAIYSFSDKIQPEIVAPASSFPNLKNFKKLKRSVSGALGKSKEPGTVSSLDENWVLSRSVPNLYNNSYQYKWSDIGPPDQDEELMMSSLTNPASFSYLATGGHVMYLPEYKSPNHQQHHYPVNRSQNIDHHQLVSKSCEDFSRHNNINNDTNNNDNNYNKNDIRHKLKSTNNASNLSASKPSKKFTFQSTMRQIERRRIADKLSKEAEEKERQRLRELDAMRKVEEEFQRKREKEKADIRQQLRLYNLTEGGREQSYGGILPSPPPSTQILSEFKEPRRDYRDYTPVRNDLDSVSHNDLILKRETVHPEVVFQMPKNAQVYVTPHFNNMGVPNMNQSGIESVISTPKSSFSDNYRKNFAQGGLPHSVHSSDSEVSQSNARPTSKTKHRSSSPSSASDDNANDYKIKNSDIQFLVSKRKNGFLFGNFSLKKSKPKIEETIPSFSVIQEPIVEISGIIKQKFSESPVPESVTTLPLPTKRSFSLRPFIRNKTYKPMNFTQSSIIDHNSLAQIKI